MTSVFKVRGEIPSGSPHIYNPLATGQSVDTCWCVNNLVGIDAAAGASRLHHDVTSHWRIMSDY
jgi:hypothetical protein